MPEIRMRRKNQITLPASIVRQARIEPDDRLIVSFLGGNIVITPKKVVEEKSDIMSYAGMFTGTWGNTPEAVEATIRNLRDEWSN